MKIVAVAVAGASMGPQPLSAQEVRLFSIGSGDIAGNYFSVARAICDAFNDHDETRRRCSPEPTAGSIYNLRMLASGELGFALVQSDWQTAAYEGMAPFSGAEPMRDLRTAMWLYPESVTIIGAPGSGIRVAADLAGKTVDIGRPASGRNATFRSLIARLDISEDFFGELRELEPSAAIEELCTGQIDATVFVVGHPSKLVSDALNKCDAVISDFAGPRIKEVLASSSDFQRSVIDLGLYGFPGERVETVSVMATLVTLESMDQSLVSDLVGAIRTDVDRLKVKTPVLGTLDLYLDTPSATVVPMHPGAVSGN
ncbi:TAXI family TRAP transporter solute-binding subunit [Defluviimonas sp. D31]|uniref:TAXI family TRAP transporter solute-binding subunit n=1 Tax=Defluviimonas sp. D31 TaxID=3083253 RepID=UPI00296EC1E7|nr:TAXI family TRAP transporter solute-binding subunit [Defluviimonas sp. D31]MDW4550382.1 TAXI family TRAP transporter solute-binding subunit [Defluviimonas sp. D31]